MTDHPDGLIRRTRTVSDLFHKTCWSFLQGGGNMVDPYRCRCGTWEYDVEAVQWRLTPGGGDVER
jgi:hypothetical protein